MVRFLLTAVLGISVSLFSLSGYAQITPETVEKATKEVDRPIEEEITKELYIPPHKELEAITEQQEAPPEKGPTMFVKKIVLTGCKTFPPEHLKSIVEAYEGREVTLGELKTLTKTIEAEYLQKGIIASCLIPRQDIKDGQIILQVIEAKMGSLKIQEHKYFNKNRLLYYWTLNPGEILRYDKISNSLTFMNQNPDRHVKARLEGGKEPETTNILLTAKTYFPFHVTGSFDKEGSVYTGVDRKGFGIRYNNFMGIDSTLISGYSFGDDYWGVYAYQRIPISNFGTSLTCGYSYNQSSPKKDLAIYKIKSTSKNPSVFIYQDLLNKNNYLGNVYFGLYAKDKKTRMDEALIGRDRLRIFRIGGNFTYKGDKHLTYFRPEISQGVKIWGAKEKDTLTSRETDCVFTKINLQLEHKRALPLGLQLRLNFEGQLASTKLASHEQFSLGGINSVRGYTSGEFSADKAVQANAELLIPALILPPNIKLPYAERPLKDELTGLVFFDYGYGTLRFPAENATRKSANLASVGAGLRCKLYNQAFLRLEWGFPIGDATEIEAGHSRFHISLDFEEQLPREMERIQQLREDSYVEQGSWAILSEYLKTTDDISLREQFFSYPLLAENAYKKGHLEEANKYYKQIDTTGKSLYNQAEKYIKDCIAQQKKLNEYKDLALKYKQEGMLEEEKESWQKIVEEGTLKLLTLKIQE